VIREKQTQIVASEAEASSWKEECEAQIKINEANLQRFARAEQSKRTWRTVSFIGLAVGIAGGLILGIVLNE
jgi:hypothetical protein